MKKLIACLFGLIFSVPAWTATLPSGYTELEYIESDGDQYIDTGVVSNNSSKLEYVASVLSYGDKSLMYHYLFGHWGNTSDTARFNMDIISTSPSWEFGIGTGSWNPGTNGYTMPPTDIPLNTKFTVVYDAKAVYLDGTKLVQLSGDLTGNTLSFYIGAANKPNSNNYNGLAQKIYSVKLWKNGALAFDGIPAKQGNTVGMYDSVSGNFFTNSGTGEFTGGDPVATCPNGQVSHNYTSATGTVTQNGTPTPSAPVYPTFYTQGNMVLRKVGDIADSYDATTGKITRRVGVVRLTGDENCVRFDSSLSVIACNGVVPNYNTSTRMVISNTFKYNSRHNSTATLVEGEIFKGDMSNAIYLNYGEWTETKLQEFMNMLQDRNSAGNPVTIYYPLQDPVEEDWAATTYCITQIKIATTAYNTARFSPVVTELNDTIATIRSVVTNTINQTKAIADLQATKQTRPDETCPAGKKCLLVEDNAGQPHWYEIIESAYGLPNGYTALEYIESTGTQYIELDIPMYSNYTYKTVYEYTNKATGALFGASDTTSFNTGSIIAHTYAGNALAIYAKQGEGAASGGIGPVNNNEVYTAIWTPKTGVININGTDFSAVSQSFTNADFATSYKECLFALNAPAVRAYTNGERIYSHQVYNGSVLLVDLVPAKNSSNVIGMYDLVSGQFFTNKGTGTFVAGSEI